MPSLRWLRTRLVPGVLALSLLSGLYGCGREADVILRGGTIYDGSGAEPVVGDVVIQGDRVAAVGDAAGWKAPVEVDATGMAVAPGFINMLSWATETLLEDPRGLSDIKQGVTLEVFGEGESMGPLNEAMRVEMIERQGDIKFEVPWTTLGEYLEHLETRGVSPNVASFVGATTVRIHEVGYDNRAPTAEELASMQSLVRQGMEEGAMGVGSSLIYAPAFYADTPELVALMEAAAEYGGMYISHMRSEGNQILESVDELIHIARSSGAPAEIYHLKQAGQANWDKLDAVIERVETARAEGIRITADMYTYTAGATGLDAAMPPWVQEGGYDAWAARLQDPAVRRRVINEMRTPTDDWENLMLLAGDPSRVLLVGFKADSLKHLTGMTLAAVAEERGMSPEETAIDLVIKDGSRVGTVYFLMSEDNVRRQIQLPWIAFDSDAGAPAPEGVFLQSNPHPRAYGNFARLLGRYVRDEGLIPMEEAIHKLSGFPATNLQLRERGFLRPGYFADVVVFDPAGIRDLATFEDPHQLAEGMVHVFVNGVQVLRDGAHTGATPGRVVRGPGWVGWIDEGAEAEAAVPSDPEAGEPQAISLFGEPLYAQMDTTGAIAEADRALSADPANVELLIEAGRVRRNFWQYRQAMELYTQAIHLSPEDWRPYRYRGHRHLSLREFDLGVTDLERARELAPMNWDVSYHLGLAYFLAGRFEDAKREYLRCLDLAGNEEARAYQSDGFRSCSQNGDDPESFVAMTEWAVRAALRAGDADAVESLLAGVSLDLPVETNVAYYHDLLFYKGEMTADQLLDPGPDAPYRMETVGFGVANWRLASGDTAGAVALLEELVLDPWWPGFGRLAAEAELARLTKPAVGVG